MYALETDGNVITYAANTQRAYTYAQKIGGKINIWYIVTEDYWELYDFGNFR